MRLFELTKNADSARKVQIPLDPYGRAAMVVPRFVFFRPTDPPVQIDEGIRSRRLSPDDQHLARGHFLNATPDDRFVWLSLQPFDDYCVEIDLTRLNRREVRAARHESKDLLYRGDIPADAITRVLNAPPLNEQ